MTKKEKALDNATIQSSMTLAAQLKALNHEAGFKLKAHDKDGKISVLECTKREHLSSLGLEPHYVGKKCVGYTPATFNAAVCDELKEVIDGKVVATYVYVDRVCTVTLDDDTIGTRDYSLYTSDEADKKVKGESGAKSCKLYRKATIGEFGWTPGICVKVLRQSSQIADEIKRAEESAAKFAKQKEAGLYIVKNIEGTLHKIKVNV